MKDHKLRVLDDALACGHSVNPQLPIALVVRNDVVYITPKTARELAEHLNKLADEIEGK